MNKIFRAGLLSIGDEILIGQVVNTNAAWLSEQLTSSGLSISNHLSVADEKSDIMDGLSALIANSDIVVVTGGLGPTKDDLTKTALASYFDDELIFHQETFDRLKQLMHRFGRTIKDNQRHQCLLPAKATILNNDLGTAPGMHFIKENIHYFFMPGVPFEMKHLFQDRIKSILEYHGMTSNHVLTQTILTAGIGEATLEDQIADIVESFPRGLGISYLPGKAQVRLRLTGRSITHETMNNFRFQIEERLAPGVFGHEKETLESVIGQFLLRKGWTIGFAESCTGGAVSAKITTIAGASSYFLGSVISYSNEVKHKILGVSLDTLEHHGAVSKACVREMVAGALKTLDVDVAVAISGIAGPDGGSEDKPVGTVFIGVGDANIIKVKRLNATKSRVINIEYFTSYALNLLRLFLLDKPG